MALIVYLVIAFILFLVLLILFSLFARNFYLASQCEVSPTAWCYDDWVCQNKASGGDISPCFDLDSNLASCLAGDNSTYKSGCGDNCPCPTSDSNGINCLSGCPLTLDDVNPNVTCCTKDNPC